jgi:hypothetical protein
LEAEELKGVKTAHIGNRVLSSNREVMSFAKPGATTSELIANLIKENNLGVDPDIATNLLMGIEEGSSNFASPEVTPDTFETFAYLLRSGGQRSPKTKLSPMSFPAGSIPTQPFNQAPAAAAPMAEPILEQVEAKEEAIENPPEDWLQPKVYKGTSVS